MQPAQLFDRAVEKIGVVDHQGDAVLLAQRHQLSGLRHAGAHRFFDQHMLAAEERPARQSKVGGRGGSDRHRLHFGIVDHLRPIGIQTDRPTRSANLAPRAFPDIGHGHDLEPRITRKSPKQVLAPIAVTTEPDFDDAHTVCLAMSILTSRTTRNSRDGPWKRLGSEFARVFMLHQSCARFKRLANHSGTNGLDW